MAIRVRYARKSDLDSLLGLWWKLHQFHVKSLKAKKDFVYVPDVLERMRDHYATKVIPAKQAIIADDGGEHVAFCEFAESSRPPIYRRPKILKIWCLYVLPECRGKGVGKKLLQRLKQIRQSRGMDGIEVSSHVHNVNAISFYTSLGFRKRMVEMIM